MRSELPHLLTSPNMLGLTETTVHQQYQGDLTQNSLSLSSLLTDDSNTCSDLLAKAMKFAHIRQDSTQYVPCNVPDDQISASVGDASVPHSSHEVTGAVNHGVDTKWSREADRLILETVKQQGPASETYEWLARQLGIWTSEQVSDRFDHLMQLFSEGQETDEEDLEPSPS
ncbi:hypothetical protein C0Q70_20208 [Pomacea canaliculata]|uniref:Myb-like domain-containing protein n=1 Tax=Pomacea canaliculata TaxID=400727 RepID=A0A2T7NEV7_POMCA|nr:hypothetical protein C0Q70_20208 [Pomacea canaliculata]